MKRFILAMAVVAIGLGLSTSAQAALIPGNGSFGYAPFQIGNTPAVSFTGASLGAATSVTISATEVVNSVTDPYLGNPNNLGVSVLDSVGVSPLTLSALSTTLVAGGVVPTGVYLSF